MSNSNSSSKSLFTYAVIVFITLFSYMLFSHGPRASALSGNDFEAGNIIDDVLFYDGDSMTESQIQQFLNTKVPNCDTNGVKMHSSGITRAQRGINNNNPPPFVCLKDKRWDTSFKAGESGLCSAIPAKTNRSAAQIIYDVGKACNISQKAIIVTLQKEQGLITDDWPWEVQYTKAMGYYCPDDPDRPGWCHPDYAGFFNQVYNAALQLQRYRANPHGWNHIPGAMNQISYQANAPSCGKKSVYIENYATAGLYNFTPYTPNKAALDNLYGTGDSCSAYGNRNFWRFYNDWFGSTKGTYLLRSINNATVYLVVGSVKHPISNINTLNALSRLGPVGYVSDAYLSRKSDGNPVGRLLRAEDGTIYFFDSSIKLPFTSCSVIEHYGLGDGCGNFVNVSKQIADRLVTGPSMTRVTGLTNGKRFYAENGKKREIFDNTSAQQLGLGSVHNVLSNSVLDYLQYGSPVVRSNVAIVDRQNKSKVYTYSGNLAHLIPEKLRTQTNFLSNIPKAELDSYSIGNITKGQNVSGFIRNKSTGERYVVESTGKALLTNPSNWTDRFIDLDSGIIAMIPNSSRSISNNMIKSPNDGTVFYVSDGKKRAIHDWNDFLLMNPIPQTINILSDTTMSSIPSGARLVAPGRMVKKPNDGTVYVVDSLTGLFPLSSFSISDNLGVRGPVVTLSNNDLSSFNIHSSNLSPAVVCNGKKYLSNDGLLHEISGGSQDHFNLRFSELSSGICKNLKTGTKVLRFLRSRDGTIYHISDSKKYAIRSYSTYLNMNPDNSFIQVSDHTLSLFSLAGYL